MLKLNQQIFIKVNEEPNLYIFKVDNVVSWLASTCQFFPSKVVGMFYAIFLHASHGTHFFVSNIKQIALLLLLGSLCQMGY